MKLRERNAHGERLNLVPIASLRPPSIRLAAVVAALLFVAPACGGSSGDQSANNASPLEALFGGNESPAETRRKQLAVEESVAQCMKDLGWEYKPVDYEAQFQSGGEEQLSPKEFGEKYGYGNVHNYLLYELPYIGGGDGPPPDPGPVFVDPNQDYVNSLTPDEQTDYYAALYGKPVETDDGFGVGVAGLIAPPDTGTGDTTPGDTTPVDITPGDTVPPVEDRGCFGIAQAAIFGESPFDDSDFAQRFNDLSQQLENDPRLQDALADWSDCMYEVDASYDFLTVDEPSTLFQKTMATAKGLKTLPVDPETGEPIGEFDQSLPWYTATYSDGTGWAFIGEPEKIPDADVDVLQAEELKLWKLDQSCQKSVKLDELRKQLEQEIVDTLQGEFPDLGQSGN